MDGFSRYHGELAWDKTPIIANDRDRDSILKAMFYDETAPSGMTKMIKELNKIYIGFSARGVRAWVRKQQAYQDSRTVYRQAAKVAMIIPKIPFHTVETDCMLFSTNEADLRANGGYYILSTYTD